MSLLKTEILSLNPPLYWTGEDAVGSTHLTNFGTVGSSGNASISAGALLGGIPLTADGGETSIFQPGNSANEGWNAGVQSSAIIGAADSVTYFCVFVSYAPVGRTAQMCFQGTVNAFGGIGLGLSPNGFPSPQVSDVATHLGGVAVPPALNDGVPHSLSLVRDVSTNLLTTYLDGAIIESIADPTAGVAISNASNSSVIGNWHLFNSSWIGLLGHHFIIKAVVGGIEQAVLFNKMWNGKPPAAGGGFQANTTTALGNATASLADATASLAAILAAVKKRY